MSAENFAQMFEASVTGQALAPGRVFNGRVLAIDIAHGLVTIDTPLKSEGYVKLEEFLNKDGKLEISVGDLVPVALEAFEDGRGETRLSRQRAKRQEVWNRLIEAFDKQENVTGVICGRVKGGFTVDIDSVRAFLPGSLVDVRPTKDISHLEGIDVEFKVIKIDQKRNNVVVSRRSIVESEFSADKEALVQGLEEGMDIKGVVKNLTDYGAFIDLGGVDGLLHITDIAWKRVKHPSEVLSIGQELNVKVLRFDKEKMRVSLGLKQIGSDPWDGISARYPVGSRMQGKVTNITDYGCFVELEDGIEGLVHVSEMDWTNKNIHPSKVVDVAQTIEVMVLDIDGERRRISLGIKQCKDSPWAAFAAVHNKGDKIVGKIKSITDFGIFIGLEGNIDGLVHLTDISWNVPGEEAVASYKKGDEIEAVVLAIDPERERISLGVKQLEEDPFSHFVADNAKGSIVSGVVTEIDTKGAVIALSNGVEGYLKAADFSREENIDDLRTKLNVGDVIEAKFMNIDRKKRCINLSVKAKESQEEKDSIAEYKNGNGATGTLGDVLGESFDK